MDRSHNWYTTSQVSELLGRSDRFVRDRIKSGEIAASEHKGAKRSSYKISTEALASYMVVAGQKNDSEKLKEALEGCSLEYLQECQQLISQQLARSEPVVVVEKTEEIYRPVFDLMQRALPSDFLYGEAPYRTYFNNPALLMSVAFDRVKNRAEGVFCVAVTTSRYYEQLCANTVREDHQPPCGPSDTPALYLDTLILEDPIWAAYVFRDIRRQIARAVAGRRVLGAFTVASDPLSHRMALKYGLEQVGEYGKSRFPIMMGRELKLLGEANL